MIRLVLAGAFLALFSSSTWAADPFTLYILRMLRDQMISATLESGVALRQQTPERAVAPSVRAEPSPPEGQWLKTLIDESFLHLGPQQREQLHASLTAMLSDPKNAALRSDILSEFTRQATAMRESHRQLSRLSVADMKLVAMEARSEFERLPAEQRQQLLQALQLGVPGMPRSLQDMMLAEFNSVPPAR